MIPQPKILTRIDVPAGGWLFRIKASVAAPFDTTINATVAAGSYYMAWDTTADDLLYEIQSKMQTAITAAGIVGKIFAWIDSSHKIRLSFEGTGFQGATKRQVRLDWPASAADLAKALGFDSSAVDDLTASDNPQTTADYHHAHGWYADEDGVLKGAPPEDWNEVNVVSAMSHAGLQKGALMGERFFSSLELYGMARAKTWSGGKGYGETPTHPYARNEGLECWWRAARAGQPFRVYHDGQIVSTAAKAADYGTTMTTNSTTGFTRADRAWSIEPQRWASRILYMPSYSATNAAPCRWRVTSNTATGITVTAHPSALALGSAWTTWALLDQPFQTYQVELEKMREFKPEEIPAIDEYMLTIPLTRYVAP